MFDLFETISKEKAKNMSPIVLAYIGDAVFSLYAREKLAFIADFKVNELHKKASAEVNATAQAELIEKILPTLTEEEIAVYKNGRNAKKSTKSKNAKASDYVKSTGFEALVGYLFITGERERLKSLLSTSEGV